jgi:hypothetical protein
MLYAHLCFLIVFTQVFLCMRSFDIIFVFLTLTIQSKDGDKFDESIRTDLLKLRTYGTYVSDFALF